MTDQEIVTMAHIRQAAGVNEKPMLQEMPGVIAKLKAASDHMAVARIEAGCPDDEVLVEHIRTLRADCNRAADLVDKLTDALRVVVVGRTPKDRSDLAALLRLREVARGVLPSNDQAQAMPS